MVRLTPDQVEWLQATYQQHSLVETTALFNAHYGATYHPSSLKACFPFYKIKSGRYRWMTRVHNRAWLPEHIEWLRVARQDYPIRQLVERFNAHWGQQRTEDQITSACFRYRIASPRNGNFAPGHQPWNKGLKGVHVGGVATRFKKGERSMCATPIGTLTQHYGVWKIKVSEVHGATESRHDWIYVHRQIWEAAHGPQPKGTAIVFVDGNHDNLNLDNLELVTRAELARLNQLGWRRLQHAGPRRAMIAQVRLITAAHHLATARGLDLPTRRRLLPAIPKIRPQAEETAPCC